MRRLSFMLLLCLSAVPSSRSKVFEGNPDISSILRRERELRERRREDVLEEVKLRAKEMGINAPAEAMTSLLFQKAWLLLELDKCKIKNGEGDLCQELSRALSDVERQFQYLSGVTSDEFQKGYRIEHLRTTFYENQSPWYCQCDVLIYSSDRWMNPYWGLECNGHGGHAYCDEGVDRLHSAGRGAMTGVIFVSFGGFYRTLECPDDQRTCFKGPVNGEWSTLCSCDWLHFPSYFEFDNEEVFQLGILEWTVDGPCDESGIYVFEDIYEHDPVCCDDYMGTLVAGGGGEGQRSVVMMTSYTNCNGGSQSGRLPYCGSFGTSIRM